MSQKIAMIGAGSIVFCKTLMSDIMATPALADSEFALMDAVGAEAAPRWRSSASACSRTTDSPGACGRRSTGARPSGTRTSSW